MRLVICSVYIKVAVVKLDRDFNGQAIQHKVVLIPLVARLPVYFRFFYSKKGVLLGLIAVVTHIF